MVGKQSTERIQFIRQGRLELVLSCFGDHLVNVSIYDFSSLWLGSKGQWACVGRKSTESHPPPALQNIEQVCDRKSIGMESVLGQFAGLNLLQGKFQTFCEKSNPLSKGWSRLDVATLELAGVVWPGTVIYFQTPHLNLSAPPAPRSNLFYIHFWNNELQQFFLSCDYE